MRFAFVLILFVAVSAMAACEKSSFNFYDSEKMGDQQKEKEAEVSPPITASINLATVVLSSGGKESSVTTEIAQTESERAKGLSGRESLPEGNGMLFIFPEEGLEKFWMKDTAIPLDLIYMDKDKNIVDIITYAVPYDLKLLESKEPFMYVLEVNAGFVKDKNINIGDKVEVRIGPK
ncbi:MAG: DUF192 domain-containing protein [Pseudomonadota bacterium]